MYRHKSREDLFRSMEYDAFKSMVNRRSVCKDNQCVNCWKPVAVGRSMRCCTQDCAEEYLRMLKYWSTFAMIRPDNEEVLVNESYDEIKESIDAQEIQVESWKCPSPPSTSPSNSAKSALKKSLLNYTPTMIEKAVSR
jgi:hypothetical protein